MFIQKKENKKKEKRTEKVARVREDPSALNAFARFSLQVRDNRRS